MTTHHPTRPAWTCEPCDQPWPCDTARMELGEQYADDRVGLSIHMADQLNLATRDEASTSPQELYARFVAWTR